MPLFVLLVLVPIIEIALFIEVGGFLGLWPTIGIVILTALIGSAMLRSQGAGAMRDLQGSMSGKGDPAKALAHGAMILVSGVLLLTPGFFTDALGFALLVPGFRSLVMSFVARRMAGRVHMSAGGMHAEWRGGPGQDGSGRPGSGQGGRPGQGPAGAHRPGPARDPDVIDAEFEEVPRDPNAPPSGWTRPPEG